MLSPSALLFVVAISVSGGVQDVVSAAQAAETELSYDRAVELWLDVLAEPALDEDIKLNGHVRLATLYRILGDEGESRSHFRWVLAKKPDFQLPADAPRKVAAFFEMVREEMQATQPPPAPPPAPAVEAPPATTAPAPTEAPPRAFGNPATPLLFAGAGVSMAGAGAALLVSFIAFGDGDKLQREALAEQVQIARDEVYDQRDASYGMGNVAFAAASAAAVIGTVLFAGAFVEVP